ncbi:unnamed protein product, partial [Rotaria sp. Silwood1]
MRYVDWYQLRDDPSQHTGTK